MSIKLFSVKQNFERPKVESIEQTVISEVRPLFEQSIAPGQRVGITLGSRGVQNIVKIIKIIISEVKRRNAVPVLLAAMGSHGGGTEEGQREVLESLGFSDSDMGAEILCCASSREVGKTGDGLSAFALESAFKVDWIFPVNRVKTHTAFKGKLESGIIKKLVVGLGGPSGAGQFHSLGASQLARVLTEIGTILIDKLPVLGGLGIVENAYEETAVLRAAPAKSLIAEEEKLLIRSKELMPSLPAEKLDALIIQEMGKNFSGTGIDTNIIGRLRVDGEPEPEGPSVKRVAVLDISEESHGNATGVGLADMITQKLASKIDRKSTYLNCLTTGFVKRAFTPMVFDTEKEIFGAVLKSLGNMPEEKLRLTIIPNTLFLTECFVSASVAEELKNRPEIAVDNSAFELRFNSAGEIERKIALSVHS